MTAGSTAATLARALGGEVTPALAAQLAGSLPLRARLIEMRAGRIRRGRSDSDLLRLLDLDDQAVAALPLQVGSAWHAASVLRVVDGATIRQLTAQLGFDPRPVALRHGPRHLVPAVAPSELARRIAEDGAGCLEAWCAQQDDLGGSYGRFRLVAGAPDASHRSYGPPLVRALLTGTPSA